MHDAINTLASKERDRQSLAALMASHISADLAVTELPSYEQKPIPPRRSKIDPETRLKRKPVTTIRKAGGRA